MQPHKKNESNEPVVSDGGASVVTTSSATASSVNSLTVLEENVARDNLLSSSDSSGANKLASDDQSTQLTDDEKALDATERDTTEQARSDEFVGYEHLTIGNAAFNLFLRGKQWIDGTSLETALREAGLYNTSSELKVSNAVFLYPGELSALFGDFYADIKHPISLGRNGRVQMDRFRKGYRTLSEIDGEAELKILADLRKTFQNERDAVREAMNAKEQPSRRLKGVSSNCHYHHLMQYHTLGFTSSRYVDALKNNFDHFAEQAADAYLAGHKVALETASAAFKESDPSNKLELLVESICQELSASHFLMDGHASGHIDTPRLELWNYVHARNKVYELADSLSLTSGVVAGLLANAMHDEGNDLGLAVENDDVLENGEKDKWTAYGDHKLFDSVNLGNAKRVREAVLRGLEQIFDAFQNKPVVAEAFKQFMPKPSLPLSRVSMFAKRGDTVVVRKKLSQSNRTPTGADDYRENWDPLWTLLKIKLGKAWYGEAKNKEKPILTEEQLIRMRNLIELAEPVEYASTALRK